MSQEVSFVAEEINSIVKDILESLLASVTYQHSRISQLTEQVIEEVLKKLVAQKRPYKYLVSAVIMQRTGAGLHTACSAFWDTTSDGVAVVRWENRSIYCVVTIFGVAI
ncbi:Tctex-1 family protein [Spironucleus salmonicida]|uniref:Dynein light chain Tctex-type 1 n=1 Tax=Spironucleus salmonicida TaxID=348837 RepID=V6M0J8_9EUKA|nr:Tctex-1 family protein [Spironucleus salmonicida]|eukprot:EST49571.1 Dynein light chain Tctex-type 1 [Spironucleus salmonicida]